MPFELVPTQDGSLSCVDSETGQLSHNSAGAYMESVQLYARSSGLLDLVMERHEIRVLDACYGMGYNTWSLINELVQLEQSPDFQQKMKNRTPQAPVLISVVCIEKNPEVLEFLPLVLNHPTFDLLNEKIAPSEHNAYYRTLQCSSDTKGEGWEVRKLAMDVAPFWRIEVELWVDDLRHRVSQLSGAFDAVFHDPFSPQKMPELWTCDLFARYYALLRERSGRVLTYSGAAAVRGGLLEAGFQVSKTAPVGSKTGGTLACISQESETLTSRSTLNQTESGPLADWEQEYLRSKAGIPYRDPELKLSRKEILALREAEQALSPRPSGGSALKNKPRYVANRV